MATKVKRSAGIRYARNLIESEIILEALKAAKWNKTKAAQRLGIHKTTLFRAIKRLGIELHKQGSYAATYLAMLVTSMLLYHLNRPFPKDIKEGYRS